jgi:paraquat-inducible protein B
VDRQVAPVTGDLKKILVNFNKLVRDADISMKLLTNNLDRTLEKLSGIVTEDSPLIIEIQDALSKFSAMSSSVRQLADYLEQHPEALLKGRGQQ